MKFENTGLEKLQVNLTVLDDILPEHGLTRDGQWDYERVTYDRKFELKEGVYYLRVMGEAIEGDVGSNKALIQVKTPILGKHYYPHGVEYGSTETFPKELVVQCERVLAEAKTSLEQLARVK
jgi:hypothetical protein